MSPNYRIEQWTVLVSHGFRGAGMNLQSVRGEKNLPPPTPDKIENPDFIFYIAFFKVMLDDDQGRKQTFGQGVQNDCAPPGKFVHPLLFYHKCHYIIKRKELAM